MPTSSMFVDMERNVIEEQRALQVALELSMLGFGESLSEADAGPGGMGPFGSAVSGLSLEETRTKKSQNMTECVPVPSSEHVAEIVGRQGCKIKALRAKTNTYIKTPVRGEEPVFVVTGRKEDVAKAKREILSAAEHFSQIRASRKNSLAGLNSPPGPPANIPGHVTIQVRVPYRVVGLVVGPKGATIKRIQHQTHTYIVTPSRDKEPVFEVTGLPESVQTARREIEAHIAMRTGGGGAAPPDDADILYKSGLAAVLSNCLEAAAPTAGSAPGLVGAFSSSGSAGTYSSRSSSSSGSSGAPGRLADLVSIWGGSLDRDEVLGDSPSFDAQSIWSFSGAPVSSSRLSPASAAASDSPADSLLGSRRECFVCVEKEVTAALVPCGHNLFCLDCANSACDAAEPRCPACSLPVVQAIRIIS